MKTLIKMENFFKIVTQIDFETEYYDDKSVSYSKLKKLAKSPAMLLQEDEDSEAMRFGRLAHSFILEQEKFSKEYFVLKDEDIIARLSDRYKNVRNTSEYKTEIANRKNLSGGREIINSEDYELIETMNRAVRRDKVRHALLSNGEAEKGFKFKCELFTKEMVNIRIKPDYMNFKIMDGHLAIIDYKTTQNASERPFRREIIDYDYHLQAALYSDLLSIHYGLPTKYFIIAQEKKAPFLCNTFLLKDDVIASGRNMYESLILLYLHVIKNNIYHDFDVFIENKNSIIEVDLAYTKDINWFKKQ